MSTITYISTFVISILVIYLILKWVFPFQVELIKFLISGYIRSVLKDRK